MKTFIYQLIILSTSIYLFYLNIRVTAVSISYKRCQKDKEIWLCPNEKYCGDANQSCTNSLGSVDLNALIILVIFIIIILIVSILSLYYFCIRRKQLLTTSIGLQMPTADVEAHTQQDIACNVDLNATMSSQILARESSPPSYEQCQSQKFQHAPENI